jgi:hypothetical protein
LTRAPDAIPRHMMPPAVVRQSSATMKG